MNKKKNEKINNLVVVCAVDILITFSMIEI